MEKEESNKIIAEAIKRYPIGTVINSTGGSDNQEVTNHYFYWDGPQLRSGPDCAVYHKKMNTWAIIIKHVSEIMFNDCMLDEIYYSSMGYIMRHQPYKANNLHIKGNTYYHGTGNFDSPGHILRLATPEEKAWFIACEKEGKYIPKEAIKLSEIINRYEIY